jgi:hypothetical protein
VSSDPGPGRASARRPRRFAVAAGAVCLVAGMAVLIAGCSTGDPVAAGDREIGVLAEGFYGGDPSPSPEATITPQPGSWDGVVVPAGYRVVMISADAEADTRAVAGAVADWAAREQVELTVLEAGDDDGVERRLLEAVDGHPDLVIGAGAGVVDVFALLTAQHLEQPFLVVGAELPEPTENVVSVVWPGATFRGTGLSAADDRDASTFTPARVGDAVELGVAAELHGVLGFVLELTDSPQ